jgi:hypothetical protein
MQAEMDQLCIPACGAPVTQLQPPAAWAGPWITSLSPDNGPAAGGTTVVISGRNFSGATAVRFGANPATSFTVNSDRRSSRSRRRKGDQWTTDGRFETYE